MRSPPAPRSAAHGVSIIDLMLGLTIGLLASVVIAQVFVQSDAHRRVTAGGAEAHQSGTVSSWRMMRELRMAGGGLQHGPTLWGCGLEAWRNGTQLLPAAGWPAPFGVFPTALPLAPIVVVDGGGVAPDAILVMSGRGGGGPAPMPAAIVDDVRIDVATSVGLNGGDLLLVADMASVAPCRIGQVAAGFTPPVSGTLAPRVVPISAPGSGYTAPGGFTTLAADRDYAVLDLGTAPSISMYGVTGGALVHYDVLRTTGQAVPTVQADSVENLQVLYGVDDGTGGTANDNVVDRWVVPGSVGFETASLLAGGAGMLQIKAIRMAMVIRASEGSLAQGAAEVVMFPDLAEPLQVRMPVATAERRFARQVVDLVIPLRNQRIALCSEERRAAGVPAPGSCG